MKLNNNSSKTPLPRGKTRSKFGKNTTLVSKIPGLICPKSIFVRLGFPDTQVIRTGGASPSTNWSYNANNAYDPDPSFGSGAMPGFTEWSAFYEKYRVHSFHLRGNITALDTTPVGITVCPMPVFFANNTRTVAQIQEYGANPLSKTYSISGVNGGNSVVEFNENWDMTQVVGDGSWRSDPNYTAFISGSPATIYYLFIGAYNLNTGVNWTLGLGTSIRLYMEVEFYVRRNFTT